MSTCLRFKAHVSQNGQTDLLRTMSTLCTATELRAVPPDVSQSLPRYFSVRGASGVTVPSVTKVANEARGDARLGRTSLAMTRAGGAGCLRL